MKQKFIPVPKFIPVEDSFKQWKKDPQDAAA